MSQNRSFQTRSTSGAKPVHQVIGREISAMAGAIFAVAVSAIVMATTVAAQSPVNYNTYGLPGLIDLPTAEAAPEAELFTGISYYPDSMRATIGFQLLPRLSGVFRYSSINGKVIGGKWADGTYYDRSFDLRFQLVEESPSMPGIAVGLQDFMGTGLYEAEYLVATKAITPTLRITGGLGWGRLGQVNSIGSTGTRPTALIGEGGVPNVDRWFRGPFAAFGGIAWSPRRNITVKVEYSSDDYAVESGSITGKSIIKQRTPINIGIDYHLKNGGQLSLFALHGDTIGAQMTFVTNPKRPNSFGGSEAAPLPILVRANGSAKDLGWTADNIVSNDVRTQLADLLALENLVLEALDLQADTAVLRLGNKRYRSISQAVGRAARAMTRVLPASVETFVIIPMVDGMAASAITLRRSDLEGLENAAATEMLARTAIRDGFSLAPKSQIKPADRFRWSLGPYLHLSVFDPDSPVRFDAGARLEGAYAITPNLILSGSLTKKVVGTLADTAPIPSKLPPVRTEYPLYSKFGDPGIEHLTVAAYGRPGPNLYGRVTVGLLESMYGGISGELLWKPVSSRFALGVEVNYVKKRAYDMMFDFLDYEVLTGHASAYYQFENGFHTKVDVGRYLAGDIGATLTVEREFANGWRVGGYATLTDVSASDFGEGSFDKGVFISVPVSWLIGQPSRDRSDIVLQSLTRDGGARLNVDGRLYRRIRDYHEPQIEAGWGKFWR